METACNCKQEINEVLERVLKLADYVIKIQEEVVSLKEINRRNQELIELLKAK